MQSTRCFAERGIYFETENKFVPIFIFIFENEPTISRGYNVVNDNNLNPWKMFVHGSDKESFQ